MALYNKIIERTTDKDKEEDTRPRLLSSEFDAIGEGIDNTWNALPESVREGATNTANFIRNVFIDDPGSEWNQAILKKVLIDVEGEEVGLQKFNALNESIARGDHDPIGQVFGLAIEGISQAPRAVGLPPLDTRATTTGLALYTLGKPLMSSAYNKLNRQPWAHNYMHARGQTLRSNVDRMSRDLNVAKNVVNHIVKKGTTAYKERFGLASERVIRINAIYDDVWNKHTNTSNAISRSFKPKTLPGTNPLIQSKGLIPSVVTGKVTKNDPIALGVQEFTPGTIQGADRKPYAYKAIYNYNPSHIVNESRLSSLRNQRLFKNLNTEEQNTILGLINPIDEYTIRTENSNKTPRGNVFNPSKPSSGYPGQRKLITSDGNELGIRWSVRKGGWTLYNRSVNLQVVDKRNVWNQPSSPNKAGEARVILETKSEANRMAKRLLDRLKDSDSPEDRDLHARIVGGQNPFQVEHINNQDSSVWIERTPGVFTHAYKRNSEGNFIQPGDPENYRIVGIYDFKYLKDSIEAYMKANGLSKQYHLEMDSSNNLYVKHGNRDEDVLSRSGAKVIIHRSLDADKGVEAFNAIINGAEQKDLPTSLAHDYRRTFADWMQDPEGGLSEDARLADKGYSGPEQRMLNLQAEIEREQLKLLRTTNERTKIRIRTKLADLYSEGLEYMNQDAMDPSIRGGFNWLNRAFKDR